MQQYGWLLFALVVLGPLVGALFIERLKLDRPLRVVGMAIFIGGAIALLFYGYGMNSGARWLQAGHSPTGSAVADKAPPKAAADAAVALVQAQSQLAEEAKAKEIAQKEIDQLREQVESMASARKLASQALLQAQAKLETERTAHNRTREELKTVKGHVASLSPSSTTSPSPELAKVTANLDKERLAHLKTRNELTGAREKLALIEANHAKTVDAAVSSTTTVLEGERAAHQKTRIALRATEDQVGELEKAHKRAVTDLRKAEAELLAARKDVAGATAKLSEAEATIARLEGTAKRLAEERQKAVALPDPPRPFASTPPPRPTETVSAAPSSTQAAGGPAAQSQAATAGSATVAAAGPDGTTPLPVRPSGESTPAGAVTPDPMQATLAAGLTAPSFVLEALSEPQFIEGQPGGYYRITCRQTKAGNNRLIFDSGAYTVTGGDIQVEQCYKDLNRLVLAKLAKSSAAKLYAGGFASNRGFARPQRLPAGDNHLKVVNYLPRSKNGAGFQSAPVSQTIATSFTNKELPTLRGAYVGDLINNFSKGAVSPGVLEGEVKASADPSSRSFDLVLQIKW